MPVPDPPDRGYTEHQARATLTTLVGCELRAIRIVTLDELWTSEDGRHIEADLAIELAINDNTDDPALFAWGVNFGVEQLCVWRQPLRSVWPTHHESLWFEVPLSWPGWPSGRLQHVEASKLRPCEVGIYRAELHFEASGFRISTGGLNGSDSTALVLSPLD